MSTFSGILDEYPKISIDNFIPLVSTYFISHLHLDHIEGFEHFIPINGLKIYTSETTKKLINGRCREFKELIPFVYGLEIGITHKIDIMRLSSLRDVTVQTIEQIEVTLIPSGHCLGSVMFLFNGVAGQVLYTGDFRISVGKSLALKTQYKIGKLKSIYVDTTFLRRSCLYFPSREKSILAMVDLIEKFLLIDKENIVQVYYTTRYTLEVLYHLIYLRLNIKVHIQWEYYRQLSALDDCFFASMDHLNVNSRVHGCYIDDNNPVSQICKKKFENAKSKNHFLKIVPSAIWWADQGMRNEGIIYRVDRFTVRVCFASHSSYSEIVDLLMTLPSESIKDCVSRNDFEIKMIKENLLLEQP